MILEVIVPLYLVGKMIMTPTAKSIIGLHKMMTPKPRTLPIPSTEGIVHVQADVITNTEGERVIDFEVWVNKRQERILLTEAEVKLLRDLGGLKYFRKTGRKLPPKAVRQIIEHLTLLEREVHTARSRRVA